MFMFLCAARISIIVGNILRKRKQIHAICRQNLFLVVETRVRKNDGQEKQIR